MGVNKAFVVKNGLEVKSNLLLADATKNSVGIGTSVINYKLHVNGGIGATTIYVSGVGTVSDLSGSTITYNTGTFNTGFVTTLNATKGNIVTGVVTSLSGSTLNYTGISTVGSLYIDTTQVISNGRQLQNIVSLDATTTATIEAAIANGPNTFTDLIVTGVSTLGVTSATQLTAQNLNVTGVGTFLSSNLKIRNPANTFEYSIVGSAIAANRNLTLPLITADDTVAVLGLAQTFSAAQTFSSTLTASSTLTLTGSTTGTHVFGSNQTSGTLTFGGTSGTGLITLGRATTSQQTNIQAGATASGNTKTINFGTGGLSGSNTVINIGPTAGVGTVSINTGTNLGIGSATPTSKLDVVGNAKFTGVVTATSFYGDGSNLSNIASGVGVATAGGTVGTGATVLDFRGAGISTVTVSAGIATINITGGGGGATIGIGSTPGDAFVGVITAGNLWYNSNLGRLFIYYQDTNSAQWVDAAPFNQGGLFVSKYGDNMYAGLGVTTGSLTNPSIYFNGFTNSGFYSPAANEFGVVVSGTQKLNVNAGGISVTGVATATDFDSLSDINYKENVSTVPDALSKVEQLRGVKFDWKESGLPSYGVIAQELEEVLPELVHGNNPKTVNYNGIIGVLIEAVKELKAEVQELKNSK